MNRNLTFWMMVGIILFSVALWMGSLFRGRENGFLGWLERESPLLETFLLVISLVLAFLVAGYSVFRDQRKGESDSTSLAALSPDVALYPHHDLRWQIRIPIFSQLMLESLWVPVGMVTFVVAFPALLGLAGVGNPELRGGFIFWGLRILLIYLGVEVPIIVWVWWASGGGFTLEYMVNDTGIRYWNHEKKSHLWALYLLAWGQASYLYEGLSDSDLAMRWKDVIFSKVFDRLNVVYLNRGRRYITVVCNRDNYRDVAEYIQSHLPAMVPG